MLILEDTVESKVERDLVQVRKNPSQNRFCEGFKWSQQGMILRPPDYESDALTN